MTSTKQSLRVLTLIGNRATYFRQSKLFEIMEKDPDIDFHLMVTGSVLKSPCVEMFAKIVTTYKNIHRHFIPYNSTLYAMSMAQAELQSRCTWVMDELKPDVCIAIADRWEQLPFAQAAANLNIPLAHIQGGEDSGNIDQKIRWAITAMADLHFPTTNDAFEKLTKIDAANVFNFGCPSIDVIKDGGIQREVARVQSWRNIAENIVPKEGYAICIFHPHTKELDKLSEQSEQVYIQFLKYCEGNKLTPHIFTGNDDPGANLLFNVKDYFDGVLVHKNMVGKEFIKLLANAKFICGNSSAGIREASYLGVPSITVGDRQKGRKVANNVIQCSIEQLEVRLGWLPTRIVEPSDMFGGGNSSEKIVKKLKGFLKEEK